MIVVLFLIFCIAIFVIGMRIGRVSSKRKNKDNIQHKHIGDDPLPDPKLSVNPKQQSSTLQIRRYRKARDPIRMAKHNRKTWRKISLCLKLSGGKATFDELCEAANGHLHYGREGGNPERFIQYCIQNGWLERC